MAKRYNNRKTNIWRKNGSVRWIWKALGGILLFRLFMIGWKATKK